MVVLVTLKRNVHDFKKKKKKLEPCDPKKECRRKRCGKGQSWVKLTCLKMKKVKLIKFKYENNCVSFLPKQTECSTVSPSSKCSLPLCNKNNLDPTWINSFNCWPVILLAWPIYGKLITVHEWPRLFPAVARADLHASARGLDKCWRLSLSSAVGSLEKPASHQRSVSETHRDAVFSAGQRAHMKSPRCLRVSGVSLVATLCCLGPILLNLCNCIKRIIYLFLEKNWITDILLISSKISHFFKSTELCLLHFFSPWLFPSWAAAANQLPPSNPLLCILFSRTN